MDDGVPILGAWAPHVSARGALTGTERAAKGVLSFLPYEGIEESLCISSIAIMKEMWDKGSREGYKGKLGRKLRQRETEEQKIVGKNKVREITKKTTINKEKPAHLEWGHDPFPIFNTVVSSCCSSNIEEIKEKQANKQNKTKKNCSQTIQSFLFS